MEEIIEQLRAAHQPLSLELVLPDEDLLVEVEEELLISLPYELRSYLLNASDVVCGQLEPVTVVDPRSHTYLPEVAALAWSEGLPRELIPICAYNNGYAHISQEGSIGFWSIANGDSQKEWESFWHWVQEEWLP